MDIRFFEWIVIIEFLYGVSGFKLIAGWGSTEVNSLNMEWYLYAGFSVVKKPYEIGLSFYLYPFDYVSLDRIESQ